MYRFFTLFSLKHMQDDMKLLCGDDDDRLWDISSAVFKFNPWVKMAIFCTGNFQKARTKSAIQFLAEEAEEMVRKRPEAKVISTPLPLSCVQTTDQIRTRLAGVCTVLFISSGKEYN